MDVRTNDRQALLGWPSLGVNLKFVEIQYIYCIIYFTEVSGTFVPEGGSMCQSKQVQKGMTVN